VALTPLAPRIDGERMDWRYVTLEPGPSARTASLTVRAPDSPQPTNPAELASAGAGAWALRAFRELDAALLELRFNRPEVGVVALRTAGDRRAVLAVDRMLHENRDDGLVHEVLLNAGRVLRRVDLTAKSFFALVEPGSCFAGSLLELALASDRVYMKDAPGGDVAVATSPLNGGAFPMPHGLTRLQSRFLGDPDQVGRVLALPGDLDVARAMEAGLVTFAPDDLDWDEEVRVAVEERASLSPDALTGMEASLRFGGPETLESKIYGRLTAWQNWIFQRPNAVGERGALTLYGRPERPQFDWRRC
jgi:benzoyl-CoA-dihydrodiol lyase